MATPGPTGPSPCPLGLRLSSCTSFCEVGWSMNVSYSSRAPEMISAVAPRSGTGPLNRWKLASCSSTATKVPAAAVLRPRSSFRGLAASRTASVSSISAAYRARRWSRTSGWVLASRNKICAEHLRVMTGEADLVRQPHQRAGHVPRDCDPGDARQGMHRESLDEQRAQKVHLAWEVVEEQPLGHGSSTSDAGGGRRIEAVCGKEVLRSVKNPFARVATAHN